MSAAISPEQEVFLSHRFQLKVPMRRHLDDSPLTSLIEYEVDSGKARPIENLRGPR
jgi:hypothetical protein